MDRDRSIERQSQPRSRTILQDRSDRSRSESRSRSSSWISTNRDRIRCYRCREYDHFTTECPNTMTDEESGHDESDREALQMLMQDNLITTDEQAQIKHLNI